MGKQIELICAYTGEKFLKDKREYDRQIRNGKTLFYKDRETAWLASKEKKTKPFIEKSCLNCEKIFSVRDLKKSSNFCCHGCCSSYKWKEFKKTEKYSDFQKKVGEKSKLLAGKKRNRSGNRRIKSANGVLDFFQKIDYSEETKDLNLSNSDKTKALLNLPISFTT